MCEHDWWRNPDGTLDVETWAEDPHYGPMCKKCGEWFCMTCEEARWDALIASLGPESEPTV